MADKGKAGKHKDAKKEPASQSPSTGSVQKRVSRGKLLGARVVRGAGGKDREIEDKMGHTIVLRSLNIVKGLVADMRRDQHEIDKLKSETRHILNKLDAV